MAVHARSLLLRLHRLPSHNLHSFTSFQKLIDDGIYSPFLAYWNAQLYSSTPAKTKMDQKKPAMTVSKPDLTPERSKKLKPLARILGQGDHDAASLDPDAFLLKVLKKELKKADQSIQKYKVDIKGSFAPFEIVPTEGTSNLTLRKKTKEEEIIIKCILELEEPDDEEYLMEEDEVALNIVQHLKMNVEIRKASLGDGARFQLFCHYMTQSITIEEIVYLDKSAYVENDHPYVGPFFGDLNSHMQQCFYDLIKNKGIDTGLADLALDHLSSKYQEEYLNWAQKIRRFLKRKA